MRPAALTVVPLLLLAGTACVRTELVTPKAGSCSAETATNRWPQFEGTDGELPVVTGTGWNEGDVPPDFQLVDQFGDPVCLWQMVGNYVVLDSSALWCEPCKHIASTVACQQEAYGDDLVYMTFVIQDSFSQPADQEEAELWSQTFGLGDGTLTPVIADGGEVVTSRFPGAAPGVLPILVLLDRELRVVMSGTAEIEPDIRAELDRALGTNADSCFAE